MAKLPDIKNEIVVPENLQVNLENDTISISSEKGELSRTFSHPKVRLSVNGNTVTVECKNPRRREKAFAGTYVAHIKNMIRGLTDGFEYKMKTVFSHFPIKTSVEGNDFVIQNFLGERAARHAKILDGITVEAKGEDITVRGIDKEKVGQTVANIERATKVKKRDIRVFQDGVYRISKGAN